ncbi:MAG: hypothetical protein CSA83_01480 [Actinomycetales bacterium]|nr:MAG: hypothetical protein CSA83_01480 [Actinomycetales bacterium]
MIGKALFLSLWESPPTFPSPEKSSSSPSPVGEGRGEGKIIVEIGSGSGVLGADGCSKSQRPKKDIQYQFPTTRIHTVAVVEKALA